jgi:mannosyltransferase OCH1-like enzyme
MLPNDFYPEIYLELNYDVKNCKIESKNPSNHYLKYGIKENRIYKYSQIQDGCSLDYYNDWITKKNSNKIYDIPFKGFKNYIPKVIYITHKNINNLEIYSKKWKDLNPEWKIKLYDDELCKKFLLENYSQLHYDIFNFITNGPIKCDFWRLCILYKYGGLYVDADINPLVPLNEYIDDDDEFVTCILNKNQYNPHFILSKKNDNILKLCIDKYIELYTNKIKYDYYIYSIVNTFNNILILNVNEGIHIINNKKYKFLLNIYGDTKLYSHSFIDEHCVYNNKRIFNNRIPNYDFNKHDFIETK